MKLWNVYESHTIHIGVIGADEQDPEEQVLAWAKTCWDHRTHTITPILHVGQAHAEMLKTEKETPKTDTGFVLQARAFLKDLLDRDMFHYAVSDEVRREARRLLGDEVKK